MIPSSPVQGQYSNRVRLSLLPPVPLLTVGGVIVLPSTNFYPSGLILGMEEKEKEVKEEEEEEGPER